MADKRKQFLVATLLEVSTALILAAVAAGFVAATYPF